MTENRYANQLKVNGFEPLMQEKIEKSKVLVVGAGGLGCHVLVQLCALGLGNIVLADHDKVELQNLNRQTLYLPAHVGLPKAPTAAAVLQTFNPNVHIHAVQEMLNSKNVEELATGCDLVLDCTDNLATRYTLDAYCSRTATPLIFGGVRMYEGQFGVFNYRGGTSFKQMFPTENHFEQIEDCNTLGTFGFACQLIGAYQVNEAFKIVTGLGHVLAGKVTTIDLQTNSHFTVGF
ncbi:hypothetical protein GC194_12925 [bacterium]|nr:hypothetical protein [bacterium]